MFSRMSIKAFELAVSDDYLNQPTPLRAFRLQVISDTVPLALFEGAWCVPTLKIYLELQSLVS